MEKLKPCPFCGGKAVIAETSPSSGRFFISCVPCGIRTFSSEKQQKLVECWNRRADNG